MFLDKVPSGTVELDTILCGGFPSRSLVLLSCNPGCGKTIMATRFLHHGASERDQALQNLDAGAKVMEKLIARNLCARLGLNFTERANWTLIDYVNNVRQGTHRSVSER